MLARHALAIARSGASASRVGRRVFRRAVFRSLTSHYLIETNPRFTQYTQFISNDYLLQQLGYNPEATDRTNPGVRDGIRKRR